MGLFSQDLVVKAHLTSMSILDLSDSLQSAPVINDHRQECLYSHACKVTCVTEQTANDELSIARVYTGTALIECDGALNV